MSTKVKSRSAAATVVARPAITYRSTSWSAPPLNTEEYLLRIQTLGERVDGYIEFMCAVGTMNGSSTEAKHKAVGLFYEQLLVMEQELGRIQENLRLG